MWKDQLFIYNTIFKYDLSKEYAKEFGEIVQQLGAHETLAEELG